MDAENVQNLMDAENVQNAIDGQIVQNVMDVRTFWDATTTQCMPRNVR